MRTLRKLHRWASLACATLWLVQALSGVLLVFHWELDDATIAVQRDVPLDVGAVGARFAALNRDGDTVALYASGGAANRFDLLVEHADGRTDAVRIDGAGNELRRSPYDHDYTKTPFFQFVTVLHQTLFLHDTGKTVLGVSGVLLFTNLLLGLRLAWPRAGQVLRALRPPRAAQTAIAARYGWHRAVGLWLVAPALVLVALGTLLAFDDAVESALGADRAGPTKIASDAPLTVTPAQALTIALAAHPSATLASLHGPRADAPWFRVRVREAGELRRVYGRTSVFVDARDGRVLLDQASADASFGTRVAEALFPLHTGEAGGLAGRLLVLLLGLWLATMIALGVSLWLARRAPARAAARR